MKHDSFISVRLRINRNMHQVIYPGIDCSNLFNSNLRKHYKEMHFTTSGLSSWHLLMLLSKQAVQMEMVLWIFKVNSHITFETNTAKFSWNTWVLELLLFNIWLNFQPINRAYIQPLAYKMPAHMVWHCLVSIIVLNLPQLIWPISSG